MIHVVVYLLRGVNNKVVIGLQCTIADNKKKNMLCLIALTSSEGAGCFGPVISQ